MHTVLFASSLDDVSNAPPQLKIIHTASQSRVTHAWIDLAPDLNFFHYFFSIPVETIGAIWEPGIISCCPMHTYCPYIICTYTLLTWDVLPPQ